MLSDYIGYKLAFPSYAGTNSSQNKIYRGCLVQKWCQEELLASIQLIVQMMHKIYSTSELCINLANAGKAHL